MSTFEHPGRRVTDVLIFDEHPIVAQELARLLGNTPGLNVCATASSIEEAREAARCYAPHVVVMDPLARNSDAMGAIEEFNSTFGSAIAVFSVFDDDDSRNAAATCGASAFISKASETRELVDALLVMARQLASDESYRIASIDTVRPAFASIPSRSATADCVEK
jgi:DNA-binding NarL/FixJ family response regulator